MNPSSWRDRRVPTTSATSNGRSDGADDAGQHRVFEVVTHVRDAIGPRDDFAFRRGRRRTVPAVVANGVERFDAQVQRCQHDVGAVDGVVVAWGMNGESASSDAWPAGPCPQSWPSAAASVERDVEAGGTRDAHCDLGDLDGVGEPVAKVIVVGRDEHLALTGEAAERPAVLDAIEVALEARPESVGGFGHGPLATAFGAGGERSERNVFHRFAGRPLDEAVGPVGHPNWHVRMPKTHG